MRKDKAKAIKKKDQAQGKRQHSTEIKFLYYFANYGPFLFIILRSVYEDLEVVRQRKTTLGAKVIDYLEKINGRPPEYPIEELKEKYFLLSYIACQICFGRPIKTRRIFQYGPPSTQKTLIFSFLARVWSCAYILLAPEGMISLRQTTTMICGSLMSFRGGGGTSPPLRKRERPTPTPY